MHEIVVIPSTTIQNIKHNFAVYNLYYEQHIKELQSKCKVSGLIQINNEVMKLHPKFAEL